MFQLFLPSDVITHPRFYTVYMVESSSCRMVFCLQFVRVSVRTRQKRGNTKNSKSLQKAKIPQNMNLLTASKNSADEKKMASGKNNARKTGNHQEYFDSADLADSDLRKQAGNLRSETRKDLGAKKKDDTSISG